MIVNQFHQDRIVARGFSPICATEILQ